MNADALSPSGEVAWQHLRQHIEWASGFWLAWVFTDHTPSGRELHNRAAALMRGMGRRSEVHQPREPGELQAALVWLLTGADGCDGCVAVEVIRRSPPWAEAWDDFMMRLNERRELLREKVRGGVLLLAPAAFKERTRSVAPDLWSIRSLVFDVAPPAVGEREVDPGSSLRSESEEPPPGATDRTLAGQALAAVQEAGLVDVEARIGAAGASWAAGYLGEAREHAAVAVERAHTPALRARALATLAGIEAALEDHVAAERHYHSALQEAPEAVSARHLRKLASLLLQRGALAEALSVAERALAKSRDRRGEAGDVVGALREELLALRAVCAVQQARGDWGSAGEVCEAALALSRRVRGLAGETPQALEDESISQRRIGEVRRAQGDWPGAGDAFEASLALSRRVRGMVGDTAEALRGELNSLDRIGSVRAAQGDWSGAGQAYEEGLALSRRIRGMIGDEAWALRHEFLMLSKVGDVRMGLGDVRGAAMVYEESLALNRRIRGMVGDRAKALRDEKVGLNKVGDARIRLGDLGGAGDVYEESLALSRRIREIVGDTVEALRDESTSLNRVGDVRRTRGDWAGAEGAYEAFLALNRRIRGIVGDIPLALRDLAISLLRVAEVHAHHRRWSSAQAHVAEAIELLRAVRARTGDLPGPTRDLSDALKQLAGLNEAHAEALREEARALMRPWEAEPRGEGSGELARGTGGSTAG